MVPLDLSNPYAPLAPKLSEQDVSQALQGTLQVVDTLRVIDKRNTAHPCPISVLGSPFTAAAPNGLPHSKFRGDPSWAGQ